MPNQSNSHNNPLPLSNLINTNSKTNINNNNLSNSSKVTTVLANYGVLSPPESENQNIITSANINKTNEVEGTNNNGSNTAAKEISYTDTKVIGNGSFGVVFQASLVESGELVAIKKVLQDKRFKNRELQIMKELNHCNIVKLRYYFYCTGEKKDDIFLNLVLEYVPETVYRIARHYSKSKLMLPLLYVKVYLYQLFRALAYIHCKGICHRDIKPQNLLLDPESSVLKLCDFGSAKQLIKGEPNVSYICSRYYRAPELIFGATDYSWNIDIWSAGCVLAELMLGHPLFPGDSGVDQLVEIIKILGTPSREQIRQMNPNYVEFKFPHIKPHPWNKVFKNRVPPEAIDLISKLLEYTPSHRLSPLQACAHSFFDELRNLNTKLPSGTSLPPLYNFSPLEMNIAPALNSILIPPHYHPESQPFTADTSGLTLPSSDIVTASTISCSSSQQQPELFISGKEKGKDPSPHINIKTKSGPQHTFSNPFASPNRKATPHHVDNVSPIGKATEAISNNVKNCKISDYKVSQSSIDKSLTSTNNDNGLINSTSFSENPLPGVPVNSLLSANDENN
ncbi:unnamed protein product [Gordionus sp. m RMFG-2023]